MTIKGRLQMSISNVSLKPFTATIVPIVPQVEHWINGGAYARLRFICYFNKNY